MIHDTLCRLMTLVRLTIVIDPNATPPRQSCQITSEKILWRRDAFSRQLVGLRDASRETRMKFLVETLKFNSMNMVL